MKIKKLNPLKIFSGVIYAIIILFVILIAVGTAISSLNLGVKMYSVNSGSMAPAIPAGSLVVVKPSQDYQKEEVITFKNEADRSVNNPKITTTHRIYQVNQAADQTTYTTKGDFNPQPDFVTTDKELIIGKVLFSIPLLGFPITFTKNIEGLIILIIIPGTIIVYSEILNIKKEILLLIKKRKNEKKNS